MNPLLRLPPEFYLDLDGILRLGVSLQADHLLRLSVERIAGKNLQLQLKEAGELIQTAVLNNNNSAAELLLESEPNP